jgi:hypothetical protein
MPARAEATDADRLRSLVLARVASSGRGVEKGEIAADLSVFAGPEVPASRWREAVQVAIDGLAADRLIDARPGGIVATAAGTAAAARFLGVAASTPLSWEKALNVWLIAKAFGQRRPTPKRLAALATLEGLRAAVLVQAYGLQIKGAATPARLRQALAAVALRRAFGGETAAAVAGKSGLPARASRLLAAQLMDKPRDPSTDRRLVSALARQACGARGSDLAALRTGVLRKHFVVQPAEIAPPADVKRRAGRGVPSPVAPEVRFKDLGEGQGGGDNRNGGQTPRHQRGVETSAVEARGLTPSPQGGGESGRAWGQLGAPAQSPAVAPAALRSLDLPGFATEVRRLAAGEAQGWSGDRKAYISRVWRTVRERRPEWGLSEIEFKCMLAEAHRSGQLNLANADLKDESNIKDVQDSAVIYRNAVFHFIRVDA